MTREELGQLYERYGHLVHRRCLALLQDAQDANDALQETFMRVQRYPPDGRVESMLGWLYGICVRVCLDQVEKGKRTESWDERLLRTLRERGGSAVEERVISAETRLSLAQELSRLDEKSRQIALLHYLEGMTQEEVAVRTGYSRRTVGTKLKQLEERLRGLYDGLAPAGGGA